MNDSEYKAIGSAPLGALKVSYMSYRDKFENVFSDFIEHKYYKDMRNTCEGSCWHMEANVADHTQLVVSSYISRITTEVWSRDNYITALALLFHDIGKPPARTKKVMNGIERYVFHGHEQISMQMAIQYMMSLPKLIDSDMIYPVAWLIQNHCPYTVKTTRRLKALKATITNIYDDPNEFRNMLMADKAGRLTDNFLRHMFISQDWINNFYNIEYSVEAVDENAPVLTIMIGLPGSGKTTKCISSSDATAVSFDTWNYEHRNLDLSDTIDFEQPKHIKEEFNANFTSLVRKKENIVVDNCNLSWKSYSTFLTIARNAGYRVRANMRLVSTDDLIIRNNTRQDKSYSVSKLKSLLGKLEMPSFHNFDEIDIKVG